MSYVEIVKEGGVLHMFCEVIARVWACNPKHAWNRPLRFPQHWLRVCQLLCVPATQDNNAINNIWWLVTIGKQPVSFEPSFSTLLCPSQEYDSQQIVDVVKCVERVQQSWGGGFPDNWDCLITSLGFGNSAQSLKAQREGRKETWFRLGLARITDEESK